MEKLTGRMGGGQVTLGGFVTYRPHPGLQAHLRRAATFASVTPASASPPIRSCADRHAAELDPHRQHHGHALCPDSVQRFAIRAGPGQRAGQDSQSEVSAQQSASRSANSLHSRADGPDLAGQAVGRRGPALARHGRAAGVAGPHQHCGRRHQAGGHEVSPGARRHNLPRSGPHRSGAGCRSHHAGARLRHHHRLARHDGEAQHHLSLRSAALQRRHHLPAGVRSNPDRKARWAARPRLDSPKALPERCSARPSTRRSPTASPRYSA